MASISGNKVNHLKVKPLRGKTICIASLKEKIGNNITGIYRNAK